MLKELQRNQLPAICWVKPGESAGMMQGMALNHLLKTYKGAKRFGYVFMQDDDGNDFLAYILDGLKTTHKEMGTVEAAVAFRENGDSIEGWAIYWPERACKWCGDELRTEDDLVCGYHHLEE